MDPFQENALLGQAQAAHQRGDTRTAMEILSRVVSENPSNADARRALALLMSLIGDPVRAAAHMRIALAANPGNARWQYDLGQLLERTGELEEALEAMLRAEAGDPSEPLYPARIAMLSRRLRDEVGAKAAAERALRLNPDQNFALLALGQIAMKEGRTEEAERLARRVIEKPLDAMRQATAWHELGRALERQGRLEEAFEAHMSANRLKLQSPPAREAIRSNVVMHFPPYLGHGDAADRYRRWGEARYDDGIPAPVLLAGFPRSGTTMTEQMLAAHPAITSCEERPLCIPVRREMDAMFGGRAATRPFLDLLDELTEEQILRLRAIYRDGLVSSVPEGARHLLIVDKHPLRILDMGLMNRIFPESKSIVMIRDPRDVCLSALFQDFVINPGVVRCLSPQLCTEWYAKVIGFWCRLRPMLSLDVLEVSYEGFVADFETWAPRILAFVGVEWDDRVRGFHALAGAHVVRSSSFEAVTEKPHTRSVGRWKRYAGQLEPVLGRLEPFVEAYGYEATRTALGR